MNHCFLGSLAATKAVAGAIKWVYMNNQKCIVRPTLIDLILNELHSYTFIISMNNCNGSCNNVKDPFGRICLTNKVEDLSLLVRDN